MAIKGIKSLLPSLREKKRYVVCEVLSEKPLTDQQTVTRAIRASFLSLFGETSLAAAGMQTITTVPIMNTKPTIIHTIIRVTHIAVTPLKAALLCIRTIDTQPVIVRSIAVSGILKKAKSFL